MFECVRCPVGDRLAGAAQNETVEVLRAGEAQTARPIRAFRDQLHQPPRRSAARGQHEAQIVALHQWQQTGGGGLDQSSVFNYAPRPGHAIERLELHAERCCQCAQIVFLAQRAVGDQHTVGADPKHGCALLGSLDHVGREE
jgi:hypothetical protein